MLYQQQREYWAQTDSHVAAGPRGPLGQDLRGLPLLHAGVVPASAPSALPGVDAVQPPQLGRELPADQHAAGAHVPVEKTFAVKELLTVGGAGGG